MRYWSKDLPRTMSLAQCVQFLLTYLLTYSMVQSPSWEANCFAASQEIPRISRNPKVHYRTYKRLPPVSILGQPNPVHIPTSHLLEIHPNIIHPSTPRSPQWSLSLRFPHQDPIHPLSPPIRPTCPADLILLDFITRTILGEEYKSFNLSLCSLLHSPVTSSLLGPDILLSTKALYSIWKYCPFTFFLFTTFLRWSYVLIGTVVRLYFICLTNSETLLVLT